MPKVETLSCCVLIKLMEMPELEHEYGMYHSGLKMEHYYMTYYIELLCNNFHYQSVKTITDWLYPCSNEITHWEILK